MTFCCAALPPNRMVGAVAVSITVPVLFGIEISPGVVMNSALCPAGAVIGPKPDTV